MKISFATKINSMKRIEGKGKFIRYDMKDVS